MIGTFTSKEDLMILEQLYYGNHLSNTEIERANKLLFLLKKSLKERIN